MTASDEQELGEKKKLAPFDHEAALAQIPPEPGVYLMKDRAGTIVYVGKAKSLRARVRSYFTGADPRPFVPRLPRVLGAIDVMITGNEKEALILENTLIKRHQPRFNFMLRDDKEFLRLRIDTSEEWPWVRIVRREKKDGARYFGPYHSATAARRTLRVLNRHFMLRTCRDSVLNNRSRPCLQYQIKRCPAPCVLDVDRETYMENVHAAILFLEGKRSALVERLESRMMEASEQLDFEVAARLRDQMRAVEKVLERQRVVQTGDIDQDIYGIYREEDRICVQVLYVRGGRLQGGDAYPIRDVLSDDARVLSQLLMRHYAGGAFIPGEVLAPHAVEAQDALAEVLTEQRGRRVVVKEPKRGPKRDLVEAANRNAEQQFQQHFASVDASESTLEAIRDRLELERLPQRIECFDVSNLQGDAIVASMAVFVGGKPARSEYRKYKMRNVESQDDFGAMYEVVSRRFRRIAEGEIDEDVKLVSQEEPVPSLVVIDGGKGQLNAALQALEDLGVEGMFDIIALAKARTVETHALDPDVHHSPERIFFPGDREPLVLPQNTETIFVLQQIRDEAHRVAIGYHRKVRQKRTLRSRLDDVPGIGPRRKAALLRHFGSLSKIREASFDELVEVRGMTRPAAQHVIDHLRIEDEDARESVTGPAT